jgi:signal transduction histidine kinase
LLARAQGSPAPPAELADGLDIIETRSRSLARFMHAYARLARLPKPTPAPLDAGAWVRRVAALETRVPVEVVGGPDVTLVADGDQLDQLLINLVRNAADAALETKGRVWIEWSAADDTFELRVLDEGPGLADTANLFVPFFTTKPEGTGIGLALSRQIAEAHGGTLALANRGADGATRRRPGCTAIVRLPVSHSAQRWPGG